MTRKSINMSNLIKNGYDIYFPCMVFTCALSEKEQEYIAIFA